MAAPRDTNGIWLRITQGDTFTTPPKTISGDAINNITIRRTKTAGLWTTTPPPEQQETGTTQTKRNYSAHSLRAGFITEAKNRGIDEADIMKHTRHTSLKQMRSYDRTSSWWNRNGTSGLAL